MKINFWKTLEQPIFLPDIGTFFNQDIELAKSLVRQLADSGVTVIKGEILHDANICLPSDVNEQYFGKESHQVIYENYRELIERKTVSLDDYREIFHYAQSLNLKIVLSVYDFIGADFAKELNCFAIKVATSNITHQPLIHYIAKLQLPMIIDTGGSSLEEILRAVSWAKEAGNNDLLIEHSPPAPPNDVALHNLSFMNTIAKSTGLPIGLSDHHSAEEMLYAATALGALVLEKGVCDDYLGDEQDSAHAIKISDVETTVSKIRNIAKALGTGYRELPRLGRKIPARMGIITKQTMRKGDKLTLNNVSFAFPAKGIGTESWQHIESKTVNEDLAVGDIIQWRHINDKE